MLNKVISASFLLVASANADGLLSSLGLGDPKSIEQKDLQERVLTGAEVSSIPFEFSLTVRIFYSALPTHLSVQSSHS